MAYYVSLKQFEGPLDLLLHLISKAKVDIKDIFVSVVSGGENKVGNFKQIQYNVAGGKEKYEAAQAEKEDKAKLAELQAQETAQEKREPEPQTAEQAKKVIIDKLHISGLKVKLGFLPLTLPATIELTDIGRKTGGATLTEAWQQIWTGILKAAGVTGDQLKVLGNLTGDAAKQVTEAAGKAAAQATELVGNAAGAVGNAAGDAVNKAGEAASKALDSLKSLW